MWNADNVHFDARWRELFGVIQDGQTRTWNDQTRFGLNRKIQNGLVVMNRGALVLDTSVEGGATMGDVTQIQVRSRWTACD